jgi:hypothetical protein
MMSIGRSSFLLDSTVLEDQYILRILKIPEKYTGRSSIQCLGCHHLFGGLAATQMDDRPTLTLIDRANGQKVAVNNTKILPGEN